MLRQGFQNGLNQWKGLTSRTIKILLGCGLCFAATQLLWAWFLTQTSVANSALLHSFTPLFATVGGWIFLAQNFDRRFVIGMIIAIIGSLILGFDDFLQSTHQIQGDIIALTSAFFLAVYFLLVEKIRDQLEPINIIFYCCVVGTLVSIPFLLINQAPILPFSANGLLIIITLAFSLLVLHLLTAYALKFLSSALVGVVLLIEPILSAILAWVIFSETLNFWNLVAFPLILWGIYVATTSKSVIKDEPQIQ